MADAIQPAPRSQVDDMVPGGLPPVDLDPLADGIMMDHQRTWLADKSPLKLCEKGRRTGITFAEALDSTLIASASRTAGGDNTWYVGDSKEKGREFVALCGRFAQAIAAELVGIDEFLFEDRQDDGESKYITAWRVRFASGFLVAALSSRPANIRGLQGRVVIDEAAFHPDVRGVIDACNALLIWGGVIRIISTHNGAINPFNELIQLSRQGVYDYSLHRYTFDDAVANGLYERVCLIRKETPTAEGKQAWYQRVRRSYGNRTEAMREELDAIPRQGDGTLLPLAWIEACTRPDYHVIRWSPPAEDFVDWPEQARIATMELWLRDHVAPLLTKLPAGARCSIGGDFGMRQDRSAFAVGYVGQDLTRHIPLILEMHRCPYQQQKQALFLLIEMVPSFRNVLLDANGNGMVLAQETRQKVGPALAIELMPNDAWYRERTPRFRGAFEERTILVPADLDLRNDLMQFRVIKGVGKVPRDVRTEGYDGGRRHADAGMAVMYVHAATDAEVEEYDYQPAAGPSAGGPAGRDHDDDAGAGRLHFRRGAY